MGLEIGPGERGVGADLQRVLQPGRLQPVELPGRDEELGPLPETGVVGVLVGLAGGGEARHPVDLDQPEGRRHLRGLEVVAQRLEDEEQVVLDAVDVTLEAAAVLLGRAPEPGLGAAPPPPLKQRQVPPVVPVGHDHASRPHGGDDVAHGEAGDRDVAALTGGTTPEPGAERVTAVLHHEQLVAVGDVPQRVPVRAVAGQVGHDQGPGAIRQRVLDGRDVDLVGVGLDVDDHGHQPVSDAAGHGGGERHGRGDELVARLELGHQQVVGDLQRRGPGVDHHPVGLGPGLGHPGLEGGGAVTEPDGAAQRLEHGLDLGLVVVRPDVVDRAVGPGVGHGPRSYGLGPNRRLGDQGRAR